MELNQSPQSRDALVKTLSEFFGRDLLAIPLIKMYPHSSVAQRCGLRAATLELDTAAYPNLEYVAGARLSVYPRNPADHVALVLEHLVDDIAEGSAQRRQFQVPDAAAKHHQDQVRELTKRRAIDHDHDDRLSRLIAAHKHNALRLALTYLYDITVAPSRDLLRIMAENCHGNREHRQRLITLSSTDAHWEQWICSQLRSLKSTFEEFSSCKMSAKVLLSELSLQLPRQYSISSIKSSKRFRAEIVVFQHKFTPNQIASSLQNIKEHEQLQQIEQSLLLRTQPVAVAHGAKALQEQVPHLVSTTSTRLSGGGTSIRSIRSLTAFTSSPISTHQVKRVPSYSGPLMSLYAASSLAGSSSASRPGSGGLHALPSVGSNLSGSGKMASGTAANYSQTMTQAGASDQQHPVAGGGSGSAGSRHASKLLYEGLCSNYLLGLQPNDHIVCEFVENPRFTLKGNRERPIMMIGQDVGVVAFRPFWQQRSLEHDRAQVFYTLFKDLKPKKFGDMQMVCLTGNRCRVEDLFKHEIDSALTHKIISWATYINRDHLINVLDMAAARSTGSTLGGGGGGTSAGPPAQQPQVRLQQHSPAARARKASAGGPQVSKTPASRKRASARRAARTAKKTGSAISPVSSASSAAATTDAAGSSSNSAGPTPQHSHHRHAERPQQPRSQQQPPHQTSTQALAAKTSPSAPIPVPESDKQYLPIQSRELIDLGQRLYKLLIEDNGCLYTCCDPQMTQAIEIFVVESIYRNSNGALSRDRIMALLPIWKGRRLSTSMIAGADNGTRDTSPTPSPSASPSQSPLPVTQPKSPSPASPSSSQRDKFLFTLENPFESAQIVQEIYDTSI